MSIKLCCALPITLNCLKQSRTLFVAVDQINSRQSPLKHVLAPGSTHFSSRWFSSSNTVGNKTVNAEAEKQKNLYKRIYYGPLTPHVKAVKVFSISSSIVGIASQPILYREIVSTGNVPVIIAAYSFIGFFTIITPLLLHFITKKYVTELSYNEETNTYLAKSFNLFGITRENEFKLEDVYVPDIPGMFATFNVRGKPLFVDPRCFDNPDHYAKLMGFDKPIDFKLLDKHSSADDTPNATTSASPSSNKN